MRRAQFAEGEFYHIYNRGTEKRIVFHDTNDYYRFLYLLFACNDTAPLLNSQFHYRGSTSIVTRKQRTPLVDITCFCLMPNHYHLILREKIKAGISKFMQKLVTGYTMYFNKKYQRSGVLFQGRFKAVYVDKEAYFHHLTRYIHLNPAELREPAWKDKGIKNIKDVLRFVEKYPWSSLANYIGEHHFGPLLNLEIIKNLALPPKEYRDFISRWAAKHKDMLGALTLEN